MFKKLIISSVIFCFFLTSLGPMPEARADALLNLPAPGTMVNLSPAYAPALIKGLTVHKDNPFLFDFIVDTGNSNLSGDALKKEGDRLVKYFFACLTIPEKDLWVNLSPYEKDRIIPQALGQTALGRDLLAEDYILKQLTASLIYPERNLGKEFWDRVYAKAQAMYGTTDIPVNTFNKVWILADKATVYEHGQTAFVVEGHLKVMLDEDYLALTKHNAIANNLSSSNANMSSPNALIGDPNTTNTSRTIASTIIRQIILPELEKEVNTGKNFATLRQIFYAQVLAMWYKQNLKQALLTQVYADKSTVRGVNLKDPSIQERIYEQYLKAYKKGVFNYIKEDSQDIPRKYFSGGYAVNPAMLTTTKVLTPEVSAAMSSEVRGKVYDLAATANPQTDAAMSAPKVLGVLVALMALGAALAAKAYHHLAAGQIDDLVSISKSLAILAIVFFAISRQGHQNQDVQVAKSVSFSPKMAKLFSRSADVYLYRSLLNQFNFYWATNQRLTMDDFSIYLAEIESLYRLKSFIKSIFLIKAFSRLLTRQEVEILKANRKNIEVAGRIISNFESQEKRQNATAPLDQWSQKDEEKSRFFYLMMLNQALFYKAKGLYWLPQNFETDMNSLDHWYVQLSERQQVNLLDAISNVISADQIRFLRYRNLQRPFVRDLLGVIDATDAAMAARPSFQYSLLKMAAIVLLLGLVQSASSQKSGRHRHRHLQSPPPVVLEPLNLAVFPDGSILTLGEHLHTPGGLDVKITEINSIGGPDYMEINSITDSDKIRTHRTYRIVGELKIDGYKKIFSALNVHSIEDFDERVDQTYTRYGVFVGVHPNPEAKTNAPAAGQSNPAMKANGGIDLNTTNMQMSINKQGAGVEMDINPAMLAQIRAQGISSLSPVIFKVTPVSSVWSAMGLSIAKI